MGSVEFSYQPHKQKATLSELNTAVWRTLTEWHHGERARLFSTARGAAEI
jgi:hypothetical protein